MTGSKRTGIPDRTSRSPQELKQDFDFCDGDRDGRIDLKEFGEFLEGLEAQMSEQEVRVGFHEIDKDHDGRISLAEFAQWWNDT